MNVKNTITAAIETFGAVKQRGKAIEEAGELIVALMQYSQGRVSNAAVIDEIADVSIMCMQLKEIFGEDLVDEAIKNKLLRLDRKIAFLMDGVES